MINILGIVWIFKRVLYAYRSSGVVSAHTALGDLTVATDALSLS